MARNQGPVLNQINVVAQDIDAMADFYRRLGIKINDGPSPWNRHHRRAEMAEGAALEFDSREFAPMFNQGWPRGASGVVIGFGLPDRDAVDDTYARLIDAGYRGQQSPYDAFWGSRYAIVEDPDGNSVGLMSPGDSARRTEPPAPPS